jgi:hypothetical protein
MPCEAKRVVGLLVALPGHPFRENASSERSVHVGPFLTLNGHSEGPVQSSTTRDLRSTVETSTEIYVVGKWRKERSRASRPLDR